MAIDDPRQIAKRVERNCKAWERKLRGHSGPATIQDLRNVLEQLAALAEIDYAACWASEPHPVDTDLA
jgi:hypothetical protein